MESVRIAQGNAELFIQQALLQITSPLCVLDRGGCVTWLNQAGAELLQCAASHVIGRQHHEIQPFRALSRERCGVCQGLWNCSRGVPLGAAELNLWIGDEEHWLSAIRVPLRRHDTFDGMALIMRDITRERERDALLAGLFDMVAKLSAPGSTRHQATADDQYGTVVDHIHRSGLTKRELQILRFLVSGLNARQIAGRLCVSHNTARNHIQSILHKLDVHSKAQAVAHAIQYRLVDFPPSAEAAG